MTARWFPRFRRAVTTWRKRLMLENWEITVLEGEVPGGYASCEAQPEYLRAIITANPALAADKERSISELAAHECLHCHIEDLAQYAMLWAGDDPGRKEAVRRSEERLTSTMTTAFRRAYKD